MLIHASECSLRHCHHVQRFPSLLGLLVDCKWTASSYRAGLAKASAWPLLPSRAGFAPSSLYPNISPSAPTRDASTTYLTKYLNSMSETRWFRWHHHRRRGICRPFVMCPSQRSFSAAAYARLQSPKYMRLMRATKASTADLATMQGLWRRCGLPSVHTLHARAILRTAVSIAPEAAVVTLTFGW